MMHLKLCGSAFAAIMVLAACGQTADFVGTGPDGGTGGTKQTSGGDASGGNASGGNASGGSASAGKTSSAGSANGGKTSNGGSSSTGGSTESGGNGTGGIIDPPGPGCSTLSGNWQSCENGLVHRTEPGKCTSKLPRANAIAPTDPATDECTKDSECTAKPNGYCQVLPNGFVPTKPHNICVYGCLQDSECSDGQVCKCGEFIGSCATAPSCKSDKDCTGGALCTQYDSCPGVPVTSFACQNAKDACTTNADCTEPMKQFCSMEADHRQCVGVRCAAGAGQ